jgi:hypothetical protein
MPSWAYASSLANTGPDSTIRLSPNREKDFVFMSDFLGKRLYPALLCLIVIPVALLPKHAVHAQSNKDISWGSTIIADDPPAYQDRGLDARKFHAGTFGDDYPRAVRLTDGKWLVVFTTNVPGDSGYLLNPKGGNVLVVLQSEDQCRTWKRLSTIADPGRDVDNGEMLQLPNGDVLLAARSVRWQESYRLPVYRSSDLGLTWKRISEIDANEGKPGALGNPDKGVYEPHLYQTSPTVVAVMYSTEKHVTESPSFSQTVAEKISTDGGRTWGKEIWVASGDSEDRPGMPVWTKMNDGRYIVVYEVGGPKDYPIYCKFSDDGIHWNSGLGTPVPIQKGAPFVDGLTDGTLVLTSNNHRVSISEDFGKTWRAVPDAFPGGTDEALFSSIYQIDSEHIALMTGRARPKGGRLIAIRLGGRHTP